MARPKTKNELLEQSQEKFEKLMFFINSLSAKEQEREFIGKTMNRNIKDVLAHLHHWHLLMLKWYNTGMRGKKPEMPEKGYSWKTVPDLNREIFEKYQSYNLKEAKRLLSESFSALQNMIQQHSNDELFEKKRYKWTGSTSLGSYLISATSSHYHWALQLIKKGCPKKIETSFFNKS